MTSLRRRARAVHGWRYRRFLVAALLLLAALIPIGVVHAAGLGGHHASAPAAPPGWKIHPDTRLMLSTAQWKEDQQGPTMDQMFPPNGVAMKVPILAWWVVLELLGLLAFPFCFLVLRNLADRGFITAKTIGLLLVAYLVWIGVSLGVATFDRGFLWIVVLLLALASGATAFRVRHELVPFVRERWRTMLAGELVFLAGFAIFIALRMWYPDLGHQFSPVAPNNFGEGRMGEKQMELAFLNAVVRSRVFPPYDPFFAHGYINYYYYGFVLVGILCKLAQIIPSTGFNLAIATFFAMLLGNTFSVVNSLVRRITPAVLAAIFVGLIGNLNGGWQLIRGLMQVAVIHSSFPLIGGVLDVLSGAEQVLIARVPFPATFDFWESTRIIPPAGTPISEFPYFTYLFADLHPHLMAFPMTAAAVGLAVSLVLERGMRPRDVARTAILGSIVLGAIAVTNPWDFPTYLGVVALGSLVGAYAVRRRLDRAVLLRPVLWGIGLGTLSFLLYLPFQRSYQTVFTTGVGLVRNISPDSLKGLCDNNPAPCDQVVHDALVTPLTIYLEHFGLFVFLAVSFVALVLGLDAGGREQVRRWLTTARFMLYYRDRFPQVRRAFSVARRHSRHRPPVVDPALLIGLAILVGGLWIFDYRLLAFLVGLMGLIGLLLLRLGRDLDREPLFLLALTLVPLAVSAVTQVAYVKDFLDGGSAFRMNTIFKFYNQAWVLYAMCAALSLYYVVARLAPHPVAATPELEEQHEMALQPEPVLVAAGSDPVHHSDELSALEQAPTVPDRPRLPQSQLAIGWWRLREFTQKHTLWSLAFTVLLAGSLIYTYAGTVARETYRTTWLPENAVPFTLDGMAFMKVSYPGDFAAINWLNAHVRGASVIAETYTPRTYTWPSRVSMFTGLPDIMQGNHENVEQRYGDEIDPSSLCGAAADPSGCTQRTHSRPDDLTSLYNSTAPSEAWRVIRLYGVKYIYVGFSERQSYTAAGLAKFNRMVGNGLRVVFRGPDRTVIYQVVRRA